MKGLKLVTAPATEPVTTAEAKLHLRVDDSDRDALIARCIAAAREKIEFITGRALISQTWDLTMDSFPCGRNGNAPWWDGQQEGPITMLLAPNGVLEMPKPPLRSITSIKTYDTSNTEATFDSSSYFVDTDSTPGRVSPNFGTNWPTTTLRPIAGVKVRFVCGYADADSVPSAIKQALLMLVGHFFENPEALVVGSISKEIEFGARALLKPFEVVKM